MTKFKFDEISYWSEVKLDIVKDYAVEYSKIMSRQKIIKEYVYIDAFAGAGAHVSKRTGEFVKGSPLNALEIEPRFTKYYLIDMDADKADLLKKVSQGLDEVYVYSGDCNKVLLEKVFPNVLYKQYRRGLCLLDPYGLDLNWEVIKKAGELKTLEIFLNFPVMDMNRNVLWNNPDNVDPELAQRLSVFWGDESWKSAVYEKLLFDDLFEKVPNANDVISKAFAARLKEVAGFKYVPEPVPMRNSKGAIVYYLFFASMNQAGSTIVEYVFNKYRKRGAGPHG